MTLKISSLAAALFAQKGKFDQSEAFEELKESSGCCQIAMLTETLY